MNVVLSDKRNFRKKEDEINAALNGKTGMIQDPIKDEEGVFYMLMFCLCVPQSKAVKAQEAIDVLKSRNFFHKSLRLQTMVNVLYGRVRFHNTKARRLLDAKKQWEDIYEHSCSAYRSYKMMGPNYLQFVDLFRLVLVDMVDGMGFKLASHFLRNIGVPGLAVLDVHILNSLKERKVIENRDFSLTKQTYYDIEERMIDYASQVGVSMEQLDLLFWSNKTGYVFK